MRNSIYFITFVQNLHDTTLHDSEAFASELQKKITKEIREVMYSSALGRLKYSIIQ